MPTDPTPANRSSTSASMTSWQRMLKSAPRAISGAGRTSSPGGHSNRCPRADPAMTLMLIG